MQRFNVYLFLWQQLVSSLQLDGMGQQFLQVLLPVLHGDLQSLGQADGHFNLRHSEVTSRLREFVLWLFLEITVNLPVLVLD